MQIYLKRIVWEEEEQHQEGSSYSMLEGKHPMTVVWVDWNKSTNPDKRLYHAHIGVDYIDSYPSLESAKKACQDELDKIVMSCVEIEREWRDG